MQDGVLDAADVLVNGQPVVGSFVYQAGAAVWAGVACVVPGRLDKGVHCVGFTFCRSMALRTGCFVKRWHVPQGRARAGDGHVFWQDNGQLLIGYGYAATCWTVDDGDWAAPVALA